MDHYIDIHLLPDPELAPHQLFSGLYARLHRALAQLASEDIGVSFPGYNARKPTLGQQLRLHGTAGSLGALIATPWLHGMHDHLTLTEAAAVPTDAKHRRLSRVQTNSSPDRQTRRALRRLDKRRDGLTEAEVIQRHQEIPAKRLDLPYVVIGSRSTGQPSFPLFIHQGPLLSEPTTGRFNSYGLSQEATIPWF
jgi:CRISPR-associated endonuclease Csy4